MLEYRLVPRAGLGYGEPSTNNGKEYYLWMRPR